MVPECKPEWNREAITVFSRLPSLVASSASHVTYYNLPYSSTPSQHGWCGTCKTDNDADKGKEGYCDWSGDKKGTQSEIMRPTSKKDWGWCSRTCNNFDAAKTLQETKLDLLTLNQCSDFDSGMQFNRKNELCAGKKNYFPKVWKFKRNKGARKKSYHFKKIGTSTNYLGLKKTKYNFYVGGTDSCLGNYHQSLLVSRALK